MSIDRPQAIFGVSADAENIVMTAWPSVAATGLGRLLGRLYDSIPVKINGIKLSHILCTLLVVPVVLAVLWYVILKLFGERYVLTNRAVQRWASLSPRLIAQAALTDVGSIEVVRRPGQAFYHASDLVIYDSGGETLMRLNGVPRAEVFRQTILKARDARVLVESSLATIKARHAT